MRTAIVSDLHANLAAAQAVFNDIAKHEDITRIICLGDVVGYGPEPNETLALVMEKCEWSLLGNHEEAVLRGAVNFNPKAKMAIDWTRTEILENPSNTPEQNQRNRAYLEGMLTSRPEGKYLFVHGSPRQFTREYVMPRDANDKQKMKDIFDHMKEYSVCFIGHTHQPGVFTYESYYHPTELHNTYPLGDNEQVVINVGSVGQPRDLDPQACYVTLCADHVAWHRVPYNPEITRKKIQQLPELDNFLGDRLIEGR